MVQTRRKNGLAHEAGRIRARRFFRLRPLGAERRLHAERSARSGRHPRDLRRLSRQLEERRFELAALQADLRLLWQAERLPFPEPVASLPAASLPAAAVQEAQS